MITLELARAEARSCNASNIVGATTVSQLLQNSDSWDFTLPAHLEASEPPEARGLQRDQVRLMVSYRSDNRVQHSQFRNVGEYLQAGDVLVLNTSGTLNAALEATRADGTALELHLSTHLPADLWIVEVRQPDPLNGATKPFPTAMAGEVLQLPAGAKATLLTPYTADRTQPMPDKVRLWIATLQLPHKLSYSEPSEAYRDPSLVLGGRASLQEYLAEYGFPIRYNYVKQGWSTQYYQTVYATEKGSAEMPSAGRAFTPELITRLVAQGVQIVPLILHTGVASLEDHEPPYEEYYRIPSETARIVNTAHAHGRRVVAVGTTVVRALETVTDNEGVTHPGEGWTRLIITPERGIKAVNGMLTGLHEPRATHLAMLEALAGREHLAVTYQQALQNAYLWHEFGDLHLILP